MSLLVFKPSILFVVISCSLMSLFQGHVTCGNSTLTEPNYLILVPGASQQAAS